MAALRLLAYRTCARCSPSSPAGAMQGPAYIVELRSEDFMPARFETILETIGHTPVVKIGKLAPSGV
jgi:hypothetical protein